MIPIEFRDLNLVASTGKIIILIMIDLGIEKIYPGLLSTQGKGLDVELCAGVYRKLIFSTGHISINLAMKKKPICFLSRGRDWILTDSAEMYPILRIGFR